MFSQTGSKATPDNAKINLSYNVVTLVINPNIDLCETMVHGTQGRRLCSGI